MAGFGLAGLASGVDTNGIVEQLMQLERRSLSRLALEKSRIQARDTGLKDIQSKLNAFKAATEALRATGLWADKQAVESSDPTRVAAEATSSGAPIGGTTVRVTGLASSTQRTFAYTPSASAQTIGFTPADTSKPPTSLEVPAGASLETVASLINGRTDLPVYAAAVALDPANPTVKSLVLSSRTTGAEATSGFTVSSAALAEDAAAYKAGTNARYRLNGSTTVLQSPSNVVEDAIPGVKLTLKMVSNVEVSVNVGVPSINKDDVKAKVKSFVEAYNSLVTATRAKTTEKVNPDATTTTDALKGQLYGDTGLNGMLSVLRTGVMDTVAGNAAATDALSDLGITTGAIGAGMAAISGTLVIDDAKLSKALETDPSAVRKLLAGDGSGPGLAQRVEEVVGRQVGTNGMVDGRLKTSEGEQRRLSDTMARTEERLVQREKRLKAQFAAMEAAMQASQTQQAWLSGQLAALAVK